MTNYEARAQRIRDALSATGHSGRWLHRESGVSLPTVQNMLTGKTRATHPVLTLLEITLGLDHVQKEAV
ncbi:hypothetical protein [Deinococcus humi]|uniref:HTH cro/C1-type domain-containing protein n=1 Tax=Deinococcus humi TaxID=662880 RepID=A0A7W8JSW4_9DEIO|nr:hypothetical protein [Deinococcus humi]MBB5361383.1 hypothetical protein [Deinococcus humi]GGO19800.1 hypothetical protein GCM10008949_04460 [Deinococcus humi]